VHFSGIITGRNITRSVAGDEVKLPVRPVDDRESASSGGADISDEYDLQRVRDILCRIEIDQKREEQHLVLVIWKLQTLILAGKMEYSF
jgi:hypothetical protein